jgi:hypothetical protein
MTLQSTPTPETSHLAQVQAIFASQKCHSLYSHTFPFANHAQDHAPALLMASDKMACTHHFVCSDEQGGKGILLLQCFCRMQRHLQRQYSSSLRQLNLLITHVELLGITVIGSLKCARVLSCI